MNNNLPRKALKALIKSFIRPNLDYGDIIYDQSNNKSFCNKVETVQYNTALALTGSIRETSTVKLCKELGLESLKSRRWFRRLWCFYKIKTFGLLSYVSNSILSGVHSYNTWNSEDHCRTDTFKYSCFPWNIIEWNKLDLTLHKSFYKMFRNYLLKIIHPSPNLVYDIQNPLGLRLLTRLILGLSHLNEHKFNHTFKNCATPLCTCSLEIESTSHFFLHCDHCSNIRSTLLNELKSLDRNILKLSDTTLTNLIVYCGSQFNIKQNTFILIAVIKYILESD